MIVIPTEYMYLYISLLFTSSTLALKKSKNGGEILPNQKERLIHRRERALKDYETNKAEIERFALARKAKRDYLIKI